MNRQDGIKQIDETQWAKDEFNTLFLCLNGADGAPIHAILTMRPVYCDRGHIQLTIDGRLGLDGADSFPRFFFSFAEADAHTRTFLKWRLWHERAHPYAEIRGAFDKFKVPEGKEREFAENQLKIRRLQNLTRIRIDNASLYAGSPMHYDCTSCGADIEVPEDWATRPKLCTECQAMKDAGWLGQAEDGPTGDNGAA
jgi:hypothetical protein